MQSLTRISLTLLGLLLLGAALFMAGTRQSLAQSPALPDLGPAPDFNNEVWINSSRLRLSDLRGQVVLVNFWTFDCYNCKNVLPYVRQWNDTYAQKGLTTIGVHFPEFSYEANLDNLKAAVKALGVNWAVAQDNDGLTWRAYQNRYWPTLYLIDKTGRLRYLHIGEGAYEQTERAIQSLLAEPFDVKITEPAAFVDSQSAKPIKLADFSGKTLILAPFALDCKPCQTQFAEIQSVAADFAKANIIFVALAVSPEDKADKIAKYAAESGYKWPFWVNTSETWIKPFGKEARNTSNTPLIVLAPDGSSAKLYIGAHTADELRQLIAEIAKPS